MNDQMKRLIESEKNSDDITKEMTSEDLNKGDIHQLEGKTVDYSVILKTGTIRIKFTDGTTFVTKEDRDTRIEQD